MVLQQIFMSIGDDHRVFGKVVLILSGHIGVALNRYNLPIVRPFAALPPIPA